MTCVYELNISLINNNLPYFVSILLITKRLTCLIFQTVAIYPTDSHLVASRNLKFPILPNRAHPMPPDKMVTQRHDLLVTVFICLFTPRDQIQQHKAKSGVARLVGVSPHIPKDGGFNFSLKSIKTCIYIKNGQRT